jgi:hypothetical protein
MLTDCAARELTYFVGLEWDDADRAILAPLVDAALVWADSNTLEALAGPIVGQLWGRELREDIERALDAAAERHGHVRLVLDDAKADLAAGPEGSVLARAIVEQGGFDLAGDDLLPMHCLLCLEDGLAAKPPEERGGAALQVARLARRVLAVPPAEIRAAVAGAAVGGPDVATILATDERRRVVRDWLGRLAELGTHSIPTISEELSAAIHVATREPAEDPIWCEAVRGITAELDAEWN